MRDSKRFVQVFCIIGSFCYAGYNLDKENTGGNVLKRVKGKNLDKGNLGKFTQSHKVLTQVILTYSILSCTTVIL